MPLDQPPSPLTTVDDTRPTVSETRFLHDQSGSTSSEPSSPRSKRHHGPILEPPIGLGERSSSPRHHSSALVGTPAAVGSWPASTSSAPLPAPSSRPRTRQSTPQRYGSPPPCEWPEDDISLPSLRTDDALINAAGWSPDDLSNFYSSDDRFLSDLANNDFSSPSSYPPLTHTQPPTLGPHRQQGSHHCGPHSRTPSTHPGSEAAPSLTTLSRSTTQNSALSASTSFDSPMPFIVDRSSGGYTTASAFMELPRSTSDDMAPTTRRSSNSDGVAEPVRSAGAPRTDRRRRTSAATHPLATENTSRPNKRPKLDFDDDDDPFKDSDDKMSSVAKGADNGLDMIDLTEPNKLPEELAKPSEELPKNDNRTKLSAFQCAICMDDATALTVTHCGHLYCAQCLHSSLHVETTKGRCPMCRSKLDMKPREDYTTKTKGFYPLELKLMTRTKKGKRKAGSMS